MDIRVAAYRPVTVTTATQQGNPLVRAQVQNAAASGPVPAVDAIRGLGGNATQRADNGGYTDGVRGTLVNILA